MSGKKQLSKSKGYSWLGIEPKLQPQNSAIGIMPQSTLQVLSSPPKPLTFNSYSAIAIVLSIACYGVAPISPLITSLLPEVLQIGEITWLIVIVAIALGTGWLATGIGILREMTVAWLPLFVACLIAYIATIKGFNLYQDIRSSKSLVKQANICLNVDTVWIFEGSREIGAAGAVSYYLNQNLTKDSQSDSSYRTVMILADGGKNRIPPQFPGSTPEYLIDKQQLQQYWNSDRPTVFLTDFLRQPDDINDPENLNLPQKNIAPYIVRGPRKLYLNQTAKKIASQRCS